MKLASGFDVFAMYNSSYLYQPVISPWNGGVLNFLKGTLDATYLKLDRSFSAHASLSPSLSCDIFQNEKWND